DEREDHHCQRSGHETSCDMGRTSPEIFVRRWTMPAILIAFSGRSGAGKTTVARTLAHELDAVRVRIDSIEQAVSESAVGMESIVDVGYRAGCALAEDNLRLGRIVVADSVNPWLETRNAWRAVAERAGAGILEVEVVCSNTEEHRNRVETRDAD